MKMGKLEKLFVNSPGHSENVSRKAGELLRHADPAPGRRYLDVGTGNGRAAVDIAITYQLDVTGIDVDREQIQLARATARGVENVRFRALDGRNLPFDDGCFDIVSAFKVTHHMPGWPAAVEEMLRVLAAGGHFVYADLVVPQRVAAIGARIVKAVGFPTVSGLDRIAAANGLTLIHAIKGAIHYEAVYRKRPPTAAANPGHVAPDTRP